MDLAFYEQLPAGELYARIEAARRAKNAVILAHNYQTLDIQHAADHVGDSLGLSRIAAATDADMVVFCGVDFMAESAKILAPEKTVILPEIAASCPMAQMVTAEALADERARHPEETVVAYVNTSARVKALTDICCTSANALQVVESLGDTPILFVPDKNLGAHIAHCTDARMRLWDGYCYVHNFFSVEDVKREWEAHPDAVFLAHPECPPEVVALADRVLSTTGMADYVAAIKDPQEQFRGVILGTEIGLYHQLRELIPAVNIWPLNPFAICKTMKMTTLPKLCRAIETGTTEITLPPEIMERARASLERMIALG